MSGEPIRVLFVCTANICRSAYAGLLASHLLAGGHDPAGVVVSSAGTHGLDDRPASFRRVLTLGQLDASLDDGSVAVNRGSGGARDFLAELPTLLKPARPEQDVPDPYRCGPAAAGEAAARIEQALTRLLPRLTG